MAAVADGQTLDVDDLALRLSSCYPQSGLTVGMIRDDLRRALATARSGIPDTERLSQGAIAPGR
jgi:hypothetical protein